jgi:hypothetical protein
MKTSLKHRARALIICAFCALVLLVAIRRAGAQPFSISWWKVSGGGGTSTGAVYSVSGTIGQHDAGGPMTGNGFAVTGGFWVALQTPGGPPLSILLTATNTVIVYWPSPSTGFNLQQNNNLSTSNWVTPAETVNDNGNIKYIIVNPPIGNRYYRLKK